MPTCCHSQSEWRLQIDPLPQRADYNLFRLVIT